MTNSSLLAKIEFQIKLNIKEVLMAKTIGDFREILNHLAEKDSKEDFGVVKRNIVLNYAHNIEKMIVNELPAETKLPKEAKEQLRKLELLAKE